MESVPPSAMMSTPSDWLLGSEGEKKAEVAFHVPCKSLMEKSGPVLVNSSSSELEEQEIKKSEKMVLKIRKCLRVFIIFCF